ncbi:MAG: DUF86 domain-containing protein [Epsilonproteobacteria bacterium]|nr:DUF86 domain-containing protein [Campylobacterota bacterium]
MSEKSDYARILFAIEKIDDIFEYKNQYKTIEALLNSKLGFDATNMCIMQIGETLNKLSQELQQRHSELPIKESYLTRNYIAHDYEGVNKHIIEMIIREQLPPLKIKLQNILQELEN